MEPLDNSLAMDTSSLNLSVLNTTTNRRSGASSGIPIPLTLQPSTSTAMVCFRPVNLSLNLWIFNETDSDHVSFDTVRSHGDILRDQRDRFQVEYQKALTARTTFLSQARQWTDFSNKIHKSDAEKSLIQQVFS